MKRSFLWALLLVFTCIGYAQAQTKVTGKVTDVRTGEPVPFASVVVKGTTVGVTTDETGNYSISVPATATDLVFSSVSHENLEESIGGRSIINVVLQPASTQLDEVIVVAYGSAKRASITGSVSKITGENIAIKNTSEITRALQGEVAGVQIFNSSGQPGSNATVRIRGFGSVNSSRAPLYVVDGIPYDGDISAINPADIESTTVLKDASSSALYGSRAANGVILITTKKGSKEKPSIAVDLKYGVNMRLIPLYDVVSSPETFLELGWESLRNYSMFQNKKSLEDAGVWASQNILSSKLAIPESYNMWNANPSDVIDPVTGKFSGASRKYTPEKWSDHVFRNGKRLEAAVRFSGGSDALTYFSSFGGLKDEGYYIGSNFSRYNARTNLDFKPKTWLKNTVNLSYSYMEQNSPGQTDSQNNGFQFVNSIPTIFPVFSRDLQGNKIIDPIVGGYMYDYGIGEGNERPFGSGVNPVGSIQLDTDKSISHQFAGNANFEISFLKDFKFTSTNGLQYLGVNRSSLTNPYYGDAKGLGRIYKYRYDYTSYTATQLLSYVKKLDGGHTIDAFVAHESSYYKYQNLSGAKSTLGRSNSLEFDNAVVTTGLGSYTLDKSLESYFTQVKYDYNNKYFFNASFRRDGSSRFAKNRWGNFGSLGAAWLISQEDFMANVKWLSELRLKASYGTYGNEQFSTGIATANYYPSEDLYDVLNLNDKVSYSLAYKGNPELTWEKSNMLNIGVDFKIGEVLEGEIEYFKKRTTDMLFMKQVAISLGFANFPVNDAQLNNSGLEFNLTAHLVNTKDWKFNFRVNGAIYQNKMIKMPKDGAGNLKNLEIQGSFGWSAGHSIYDYYLREYVGVNDQGQSQWYVYYDLNASNPDAPIASLVDYLANNKNADIKRDVTTTYADATLNYVGKSAIPKITGGFGFDLSYQNIDFTTQFVYNIGGYGYDAIYASLMHNGNVGTSNWHKDILNRWTHEGQTTDVPRLSATYDKNVNSSSSRFLTSNSYLGLANIRLAYNIPASWLSKIHLSNLSVWVSGENVAFWTARKGFFPIMSESGASSRSQYPPVSTIVGGIKFQF